MLEFLLAISTDDGFQEQKGIQLKIFRFFHDSKLKPQENISKMLGMMGQ